MTTHLWPSRRPRDVPMTTVPTPETRLPRAPRVGLYDPRFEHDACGVALVADLEGQADPHAGAPGHLGPRAPGPPGSHRQRGGQRRRGRHPHPDPPRLLRRHRRLRPPGPRDLRHRAGLPLRATTTRPPPPATAIDKLAGEEGLARHRLARRAHRRRHPRLHRRGGHALHPPAVRGPDVGHGVRSAPIRPWPSTGWPSCSASAPSTRSTSVTWPSLSARTITYKGMLTSHQLAEFYPDLSDERVVSGLALVHSRFSTNTFPSWPLAHPYRYLAHNGEINTAAGNRNWMRAREALCASDLIPGLERAFPIVTPGASDSASFDEVLELLHLGGRPLHHAVLMMIPEAWENHRTMDPARRAFYRYHASLDGALGRAGRRGVHRRHGHRGGARPQRATAGPLLGDRRRHGGAGQRGGRDRRAARQGGPEGPPAAGPDVPGGHLGRPDRRRRRDQGRAGGRAPLRRVARCRPDRARGATPPDHAHPPARVGGRAASDCSATPTRSCA